MILFSEDQLRGKVKVENVVSGNRATFARDFSQTARMPVRSSMELNGAVLLLMPCYDTELNAAGVKIVSVSKKAGVHAAYELLDPATGVPIARLEANRLTDLRTAAT